MKHKLRLLIIDKSADAARQFIAELRKQRLDVSAEPVAAKNELASLLKKEEWHAVLVTSAVTGLSPAEALGVLRNKRVDLPFIVLFETLDPEAAVELIRAGAHDCLPKNDLARLAKVLKRELAAAALRNKQQLCQYKLHESERLFREAIENIRMAAVGLDIQGKVTFCNDFLLQMVNCSREELLGHDWFDEFLPEENNPKEICYDAIAQGIIPAHFESELITRNGERRLFAWNNTLSRDAKGQPSGLISIGEDITYRKQGEKKLLDQLHFIQVLIDTIPTPIFYKNPEGRYLGCNIAFEKHVGLTREFIIGKTIYDIFPRDLATIYNKGDLALIKGKGRQIYESSVACADGTQQDVIFYNAVFKNRDNSIGGLVGAILDISERKLVETKLRYMSTHDMLTDLYNRAFFDEELERLKAGRKFPVSIVMADVDRLKAVNDEQGHAAGDELLKRATLVLKAVFRKEDVVARIGGDEFAALLPNTDQVSAQEAVERLQSCIDEFNLVEPYPLMMSLGVATANNADQLMEAWRKADELMYCEKKTRYCRN
jgi:diguanylate cyclase (GGDEF)-like protein/PAS domain S-box-containing protein